MTMEIYRCNRNCGCLRCRYRGSLWGVYLMVLGALFLLDQYGVRGLSFDRTWPLQLITIGVILILIRTASTEGHIQPYAAMPGYQAVPIGDPAQSATSTTTPVDEVRHE